MSIVSFLKAIMLPKTTMIIISDFVIVIMCSNTVIKDCSVQKWRPV